MAIDRRQFLRTTAIAGGGFMFCECGLSAGALRQSQSGPRQVMVGGKRVRTVDMHSHVYVDAVWPLVQDRKEVDKGLPALAKGPMAVDTGTLERRLKEMDRQGIDVHVLSVHPSQYLYFVDADLSARIVKMQNEKIAEICAAHPDRFVGLGSVSIQHSALVAEQMDYAITKLGLRGFTVGANVNGEELVNPKFEAFWKKADELGLPILLHPAGFEDTGRRFAGPGALVNNIGFPLDTTVALSHMIFEGFFDRYAGARIVAAHGGGFLASYIGRSDNCHSLQTGCQQMKRKPSDYLKGPQLYFDSLVYNPQNLRHLVTSAGASQIVMGTDFAFPIASTTPVDTVLATPGLSAEEQIAILGGNAARLLKLK
ncbi:MAG TPA: amidohydrolase family protein [Vicinamibacterales bacterium]